MKNCKKAIARIMAFSILILGLAGCSNAAGGDNSGAGGSNSGAGGSGQTPEGFVKITGKSVGTFYMAETELTYARWYEVYQWATSDERGVYKYTFQNLGREGNSGEDGAKPTENSKQPVTNVSWRDAIVWCNAASEMEGLTPYYYESGTKVFTDKSKVIRIAENRESRGTNTDNTTDVIAKEGKADNAWFSSSNGYRLPQKKEWKYAAKGGQNCKYSGSDNIDEVAWYKDNCMVNDVKCTHDVGTKKANKYGLKDMSGNVCEWCWENGSEWNTQERACLGGSWNYGKDPCDVEYDVQFLYHYSYCAYNYTGFRVCRDAK